MCKCVGGMYVICPKKINFVIFMQFLAIFRKLSPKGLRPGICYFHLFFLLYAFF